MNGHGLTRGKCVFFAALLAATGHWLLLVFFLVLLGLPETARRIDGAGNNP